MSLPRLTFPGGCLVGDEADSSTLANKGSPRGDQVRHAGGGGGVRRLQAGRSSDELDAYGTAFQTPGFSTNCTERATSSSGCPRPLFGHADVGGSRPCSGKIPLDASPPPRDHECLRPASECRPIDYPKPDGKAHVRPPSSVLSPTRTTRRTSRAPDVERCERPGRGQSARYAVRKPLLSAACTNS